MSGASGTFEPGSAAPDFTLSDSHGQPVRLHDLFGRPVVVVFFPFAFTGVCTGEMRALAEHDQAFREAGAAVLAVSTDTRYALRVFAETERLPFALLSDFWPHGEVARRYHCFDEERGCAHRASFVLGPDLTVRWSVHTEIGSAREIGDHLRAVFEVLT